MTFQMGETGEVPAPVSTSEKPKRQASSSNLQRKFSADEGQSTPENNNSRTLRRWVHMFSSDWTKLAKAAVTTKNPSGKQVLAITVSLGQHS